MNECCTVVVPAVRLMGIPSAVRRPRGLPADAEYDYASGGYVRGGEEVAALVVLDRAECRERAGEVPRGWVAADVGDLAWVDPRTNLVFDSARPARR